MSASIPLPSGEVELLPAMRSIVRRNSGEGLRSLVSLSPSPEIRFANFDLSPMGRGGLNSASRTSDQLAACAGTSRWCFMTILLSAPR
jgi:hypothetical protein